jgi:hypothetical protein
VSDPSVPLRVVDPVHQPRFTFSIAGRALIAGVVTWQIAFHERAASSMITIDGHDALSNGLTWVTASGIILRTRLNVSDPLSRVGIMMTVTYARNAKLAGWVPVRMDEDYSQNIAEPAAGTAPGKRRREFSRASRALSYNTRAWRSSP